MSSRSRRPRARMRSKIWIVSARNQAKSGDEWHDASGHSSRQRARSRRRGVGVAVRRRRGARRSTAHFADKQREKPAMWNGRVLLGRNPVFAGDRFSASYFETDFASFLAWRDWGFPDPDRVQRLRHGRAALRRRRLRARRDGPAHVERRAHLFSVRHARSRRHQGRRGRHIRQRRARARGGDRPCARRISRASRIGTASIPACGGDDPHAARRYAGRGLARPDRGQSRRAAISRNCRRSISCAARAISPPRCRVLSRRSSRRSSRPNPDVQAFAGLRYGLRDVAASNALDIWSRYQCDRRQQEQEKRSAQKIIQGGFHAGAQSCTPARRAVCRNRGAGDGGFRRGSGKENQDRRDLRPDRPARGRRLRAAIYRRQDHARPVRQDRRRGLQGRGRLRRRPEQA